MSSPQRSPPSNKRRISLPSAPASKKPKPAPPPAPVRKLSSVSSSHPLRQTSFPPSPGPSSPPGNPSNPKTPPTNPNPNAAAAAAADDDDEEDADPNDYGTSVLTPTSFAPDESEKQKMSILLDAFTPEQNDRYDAFRRSNLNKASVKKLANQVLSQSVTQNVGTVIGGFAKVFTGEIIELALQVQRQWGMEGPLTPDVVREAARRYRVERRGAVGFRGAVGGGGGPNADGGGPGVGGSIGGGVGRLFR